jgi:two-component system phosphate regulon sensor histidine kinase PhoR
MHFRTATKTMMDSAQISSWLDDRTKRMDRANGFYRSLLAMTGHDLRHPLQVIVSVNAMLSRSLSGNSEREYLARSSDAGLQLAKQLDRLIEALRVHERLEDFSLQPVHLEFLLENVKREHGGAAKMAGLNLRIIPSRAIAMSDPFLLEGMLRNLIYNAIKYTRPGGKILIGCRKTQDRLRIEVHDTGIGISPDNLANIFEAFRRIEPAATQGLGLGLFIVRHAAESLGHKVEVRSTAGRGSCFSVVIPPAQFDSSGA